MVNGGSANNETLSLLCCTYGNRFLFLLWCFGRQKMEWNFVGAFVIVFCFLRLQNNLVWGCSVLYFIVLVQLLDM